MWRSLFAALVLAGLLGLVSCGSGDDSGPGAALIPVDVTLTQTASIRSVTIYHLDGYQFESVFTESFNNQPPPDPLSIQLQLIAGEQYRVEAETIDPTDGSQHFTAEDFIAGSNSSGNYNFQEPGSVRTQPASQHLLFSVPHMDLEIGPSGRQ